jgi:DNA replication and repair protein RecF
MIRRLTLTNFRNYRAAALATGDRPIVLFGPNGAGKTNLLEAISFLAPGRGLRRATLDDVASREGDGSWAVAAEVEGALGLATLGTGLERALEQSEAPSRACRIDREPVGSAVAFADHLRVIWLVPAMDTLFAGAPSERRRFLDRLALAVDAEHAGRVNAFERALRSRNRLLEERLPDPQWLDAVEHETAELAVAVASLRAETVSRLAAVLADRRGAAFPPAEIALDGWMEKLIPAHPAVEIEERYRGRAHARRPAPDRPLGRLRRQGNCRRRRVDRRAEGVAHRAGARACPADCGDDGVCAGAAARRGRRPSRSVATPHTPCGARTSRRAGMDDRRGPGTVRGGRGRGQHGGSQFRPA